MAEPTQRPDPTSHASSNVNVNDQVSQNSFPPRLSAVAEDPAFNFSSRRNSFLLGGPTSTVGGAPNDYHPLPSTDPANHNPSLANITSIFPRQDSIFYPRFSFDAGPGPGAGPTGSSFVGAPGGSSSSSAPNMGHQSSQEGFAYNNDMQREYSFMFPPGSHGSISNGSGNTGNFYHPFPSDRLQSIQGGPTDNLFARRQSEQLEPFVPQTGGAGQLGGIRSRQNSHFYKGRIPSISQGSGGPGADGLPSDFDFLKRDSVNRIFDTQSDLYDSIPQTAEQQQQQFQQQQQPQQQQQQQQQQSGKQQLQQPTFGHTRSTSNPFHSLPMPPPRMVVSGENGGPGSYPPPLGQQQAQQQQQQTPSIFMQNGNGKRKLSIGPMSIDPKQPDIPNTTTNNNNNNSTNSQIKLEKDRSPKRIKHTVLVPPSSSGSGIGAGLGVSNTSANLSLSDVSVSSIPGDSSASGPPSTSGSAISSDPSGNPMIKKEIPPNSLMPPQAQSIPLPPHHHQQQQQQQMQAGPPQPHLTSLIPANEAVHTEDGRPLVGATKVDQLMLVIQARKKGLTADIKQAEDGTLLEEVTPQGLISGSVLPNPMELVGGVEKTTTRGSKQHQCQYCQKKFTQSTHLEVHIRSHIGLKPFECDVCGKKFTQGGNLRTHKRLHTGEKPYGCPICKKQFSRKGNLQAHQLTHQNRRPFHCKLDNCNKYVAT
ncbi:unnamed protein product [Ambrosiozyma monospora]|uniref:Unnamed protein product n=1 Tax=Ambrosiozyma monospora TaxID=43982 RepID=A0ACB5SUP6_AMBMO|nr:unnamed protein product [Ambrosiozyma monospora]